MTPNNQDQEHLKILSICYYIMAALSIFPILFGLFYMLMGIFTGGMILSATTSHGENPAPALVGGIFVIVGLIISAISAVMGFLLYKSGKNLTNRTGYTFSFVIGCIICLSFPLGTILGVFTLIVLSRDSVKALFNGGFGAPPNPDTYGWK